MASVTTIYPSVSKQPETISNVADNDAATILTKLLTVDGADSTLDTDLLDGQHGTYYLARGNHSGTQPASTISDFASSVAAISGYIYANYAAAAAATVPAAALKITVMSAVGPLEYVDDPVGTALVDVTGRKFSPASVKCHVEHWGEVGNFVNDASKGNDNTAGFLAALTWLGVKRGGTLYAWKRYRVTDTLPMANRAVRIEMLHWERAGAGVSIGSMGVIVGDFTDGPVVHISQSEVSIHGTILATADRTAATITTGTGNVNCGILVEAPDTVSGVVSDIDIDCLVRDQPADGIACEGPMVNVYLHDSVTTNNKRHGRTFTNGQLSGRTNKGRLGIIDIGHGLSADNGGHNIAVGHPDETTNVPYRVSGARLETYRGGWDATKQYKAAANYVRAEGFTFTSGAADGANDSNVATHSTWFLSGRSITLDDTRFISAGGDCVVEIGSDASYLTRGVWIKGGKEVGSTMTNFMKVDSTASGIVFDTVDHSRSAVIAAPVLATNVKVITYNSETIYNRNNTHNVTIVSGEITVDGPGLYIIDTEGAAASDDLINILNDAAGEVYYFAQANASRVVTIKHASGGGNLRVHGATDYAFTSTSATIGFRSNGAQVVPFTAAASV